MQALRAGIDMTLVLFWWNLCYGIAHHTEFVKTAGKHGGSAEFAAPADSMRFGNALC